MPRLIDADALDNAFTALRFNTDGELAHWGDRKDWCLHGSEIEKLIADAPTVDAVEVVRCEDCRWSDPMFGICKNPTTVRCEAEINPNDYCPKGERRTE